MPGLPPKLVVTTYAPTRRWITIVVLVLIVAAGVYGMFEFGRYRAHYDVVAALKQRTELRSEIATLEATIFDLRAKVAQLESSTVGQTREREEVQRTIGDLQAQVARANQELAFFRGIVTQNANSAEVKIQQARMVATATANKFRVRVTLVQPMKPDTVVSGVVVLSVDGEVDGKPGRADFATLTGGKRREIAFTFRYLENIDEEITMPPGMKPEQLLVEVRSNRRGSAPVQQSYVWSVDPQ
jgi:cell division protein FtsB